MASREFLIRFAAGTPEHELASGIWNVWKAKNKDDIYIAPRNGVNKLKCSLHRDRRCKIGLEYSYYTRLKRQGRVIPENRFWWKRPATPPDGWFCAAEIWFPLSTLRCSNLKDREPVLLIEPPPPDKASVVSVVYSKVPESDVKLDSQIRILGYTRMNEPGEYVLVLARPVDFDYASFKAKNAPLARISGRWRYEESKTDGPRHARVLVVGIDDSNTLRILDGDRADWPEMPPL